MRFFISICVLVLVTQGCYSDGAPAGDSLAGEVDLLGPGVDAAADAPSELPGADSDSECTPKCSPDACGPDGCGGSCGTCAENWFCQDGFCVEGACTPNCVEKECGDDGCGESCGECPAAAPYCVDGFCQVECTASCVDKECGDDGCGGSCGTCPGGDMACVGGICLCTPDCQGKQCGDDGCGGSCGVCDDGNLCTDDSCEQSFCSYIALTDAPCTDGDTCTYPDTCVDGVCWPGAFICVEADCADQKDDDQDGLVDCCDDDCAASTVCQQEDVCFDGYDNDCDAATDCSDPDCESSFPCLGDTCATPISLHGSSPLDGTNLPTQFVQNGDTVYVQADLTASCDPGTNAGKDAVYSLTLDAPALATLSVTFVGTQSSAIYVHSGSCASAGPLPGPLELGAAFEELVSGFQLNDLVSQGDSGYSLMSGCEAFITDISVGPPQINLELVAGAYQLSSHIPDLSTEFEIACCYEFPYSGEYCDVFNAFPTADYIEVSGFIFLDFPDPTTTVAELGPLDVQFSNLQINSTGMSGPLLDTFINFTIGQFKDMVQVSILESYGEAVSSLLDGDEVACAVSSSDSAIIEGLLLIPGAYRIIVDSTEAGAAGPYTLTVDLNAN